MSRVTAPPPEWTLNKYHWLESERASERIVCEWIPGQGGWLPAGEEQVLSPADMCKRGWNWSAAVRRPKVWVFQDWLRDLTMQQQSVLVLACRGPDGIGRFHLTKGVVQHYRASVLKAAKTGRALLPGETEGSSIFMTLGNFDNDGIWRSNVDGFFNSVDGIAHHYYMHLMHGAEIIGYKHPEELFRKRWEEFYLRCCEDLHLYPETEQAMDERLNDWDRAHWDEK